MPAEHREFALLAARLCAQLHASSRPLEQLAADPEWLLALLERADSWRRPERFERWLEVWRACAAAGTLPRTAAERFAASAEAAQRASSAVRLGEPELRSLRGTAIAALLRERRLQALRAVM